MYAESYLKAHGQDCTILRVPENTLTKVSLQRATKAVRVYGAREAHWQGIVLSDANLQSGEVFQANEMTFLVQSVNIDPATREDAWFALWVNAMLVHKRLEQTVDPDTFYPIECWKTVNPELYAFGEIITAEMRQRDPGLLEGTRYLFQAAEGCSEVSLLDLRGTTTGTLILSGNDVDAYFNYGDVTAAALQTAVRVNYDNNDIVVEELEPDVYQFIFPLASGLQATFTWLDGDPSLTVTRAYREVIQLGDRIVYNGQNYRVDSIDDVALEGVVRLQASQDTREGGDCA